MLERRGSWGNLREQPYTTESPGDEERCAAQVWSVRGAESSNLQRISKENGRSGVRKVEGPNTKNGRIPFDA
jgi:hypothetical protein